MGKFKTISERKILRLARTELERRYDKATPASKVLIELQIEEIEERMHELWLRAREKKED